MPFIFFIFAVFVGIVAIWAITSLKSTPADKQSDEKTETYEPRTIQKPATVMDKQIRDKNPGSSVTDLPQKNYIVFFSLADGTRFGVSVEGNIYNSIKVGEQGPLTLSDGRYVDFNNRAKNGGNSYPQQRI